VNGESALVLRWTTVVVVAFVVQIGVLVDLAPFGVHADAMLLVAICAGLAAGPTRGAVVGFAAGLLADVMLPGTLGISALAYAAIGFVVGSVQDAVMSTTRTMSVVITALASAVGVLLYALVAQLLGQRSLSDPRLVQIVGIVAVLNAALCLPLLAVSRWAEGDHQRVGVR
jgi:rod shape-determining protein MreD